MRVKSQLDAEKQRISPSLTRIARVVGKHGSGRGDVSVRTKELLTATLTSRKRGRAT
jgi:hypothetical protein